jgi:subtilisin-like proprotein convertase family protein
MKSLAAGLIVLLVLAATFTSSEARWIEFNPAEPYAEPEMELVDSGYTGVSFALMIPGMEIEEVKTVQGTFARASIPGCGIEPELGSPSLPVIRKYVEIPQGAEVELHIRSVDFAETSLKELGIEHEIYPVQPPVDKVPGAREAAKFVIDRDRYSRDVFYPEKPANLGDTGQIRAHRFIQVEINPVQYNPATGEVRYLRYIELELEFEGADIAKTNTMIERLGSHDFEVFAKRNFTNAEITTGKAFLSLPIGYLIIVYDQYYEEIQSFAEMKHNLGYNVTVTKTSDIPGGVSTTNIKNYIQDAYDNWVVPPTFVLLVGDTPQIPAFTGVDSGSASDLYYATMDGAGDWLPDLFVGRFSCDSEADVTNLATKTINHTMFTLSSGTDWIKTATFMASTDNYYVSEGTHNYVINTWLLPDGYTVNKRYTYTYSATTSQVVGDLNSGISQLTYSGHGSINSWSDGPAMNSSHVNGLTNTDMLPIVQSYSCLTGSFNSACFGETWTLAPNGAVLFFGASTYSQWDEDDILERGVYDAWFGEAYNWVRGMFNEGLWDVHQYYGGGGLTRNYYEKYTVFGDPSLDMYTDPPQTFAASYSSTFPVGGTLFSADMSTAKAPVESALVCIYMDGQVYETGYTDASGHIDITLSTPPTMIGTMDVHVSKHNFIPHSGTVDVVVPAAYDISPDSIPVGTMTAVTVSVEDGEGAPMADVEVVIDGWGIGTMSDTTDALGQADFSITAPYGEDLTVTGREIGEAFDLFTGVLPVYGATDLASADIYASVDELGLYGSLAPHYEGNVRGTCSQTNFDLYAAGCGVDESIGSGGATVVDLAVTPTSTGTMQAAIGKSGYNVYVEDITVQVVFGTLAGNVYETGGAPIVGALLRGFEAGADTSSVPPVFVTSSGTGGAYTVSGDLEVGYYDVYVIKFGYVTGSEEVFVQVDANVADFYLDTAPQGTVSGTVTELGTGTPLDATIKAYRSDNMELYAQTTSDSSSGGYYEIDLPYFTYIFDVTAYHHISETENIIVDEAAEAVDFELEETLGYVLVLADSAGKTETVKLDKAGRAIAYSDGTVEGRKSASAMAQDLSELGYDIVSEDAETSNPATWGNYDIIISSSGDNTSPVSSASYRAALEDYVSSGGKLLIEGGEVGYDAASSPGYPSFASDVLHSIDWDADNAGSIVIAPGQEAHPLVTYPNSIPSSLSIGYSGWGDEDAMDPAVDAYVVMECADYSGRGGVIIYDDNASPQSAQIVYYAFNYSALSNQPTAKNLLQNSVEFLLAPEGSASCSIAGQVTLVGSSDCSGVVVSAGSTADTTDEFGNYKLTGLYASTYDVYANISGYEPGVTTGVVVEEGQVVTGIDFTLYPVIEFNYSENPGLSIPDNDPVGITSVINVPDAFDIVDIEVYVNITHTFRGDLVVSLESPSSTDVTLHDQSGSSADDINGWYDSELMVDGPGSLSDFISESATGDWTLSVSDHATYDVGTFNSWALRLWGRDPSVGIDREYVLGPISYNLAQNSPNPFNPSTSITFALASDAEIDLSIFNIRGEKVRTLASGAMSRGSHTLTWDGRDDNGSGVASGIYFYRITSEQFSGSKKMILMK